MATEPLLSTHRLGLRLDNKTLLNEIELSVHSGRTLAILGANGAGKSLLLRLLHGLVEPTQGLVKVRGGALDRRARARQAMVFQRPVMLRRSVWQNLAFAANARGIDKRQRDTRIEELLELSRLTHKRSQAARSLSGGEQQRLALARALTARPELLFLDEATASLDPASTAAIEAVIQTAIHDGTTPVLVTHDAHQARRLADDVVFLHEGQIAELGPAPELLSSPRSVAMQDWLAGRLPRTALPD